jgi:hypothetical protein
MRISHIQDGVNNLLDSLEEQMARDQNQQTHSWDPRNLGFTVFQTYVNAPELKTSFWNITQSVEQHFTKAKIVRLLPARFPASHSGWQFFMSGAGDTTHPHIDPPLTRSVFWQLVGRKLWGVWPPTKNNLAAFEEIAPTERTWKWAMENLSKEGRRFFIMEPGTWAELKICEIHACVSLTPSVHAAQELFYVEDADAILNVWKATEKAREKSTDSTKFEVGRLPEPLTEWLPAASTSQEAGLEVQQALDLYNYAFEMVMAGKSDGVTAISELCDMLPLVRVWIEKYYQQHHQ